MKNCLVFACTLLVLSGNAWAWSDHDQLVYLSLSSESWSQERVVAEELEDFLVANCHELASMLDAYESWMASQMSLYPVRPVVLALDCELAGQALVSSFLRAIRVNPEKPYGLFVQPAGWAGRTPGRAPLALAEVDVFEAEFPNSPFEAIVAGEPVSIIEVIASAADEPDYGMDVGLYVDNHTSFGALYGFGEQPFGNPALDYGSQAPFHMSFPHEDPIIKAAAPFVNLGLVEYRVSLYTALARFALTRGHQYWGYRFAGWGLHFVQDMNQPYHARLMPGMGTFRLLWMYLTGSQSEIDGAIVLLSNRHLIVEQYLFRLFTSYSGDEGLSPVFPALVGSSRRGPSSDLFRAFEVIDGISRAAYERADALDRLLVEVFPPRYVSDPSYDYGADPNMKDYDPLATLRANDPQGAEELEQYLASIMGDLGLHTRRYLDFVRSDHAVFWTPDHPSWSPYAGAASRQPPSDMRAAVYLASTLIVLLGVVLGLVFLLRRVRGRSA